MNEGRKLTIVLTRTEVNKKSWEGMFPGSPIIVLKEIELVREILLTQGMLGHGEIERVVLDGEIEPLAFLDFLSTVPPRFLGDILFITSAGSGFLSSSVPRGDGRVLYPLLNRDVAFYIRLHFDQVGHRELPSLAVAA